jgi:hypothetical protein
MININIDKAKVIVHDIRRAKRTAEFAPLDIQATIPAKAAEAEADRQAVRDKYAVIQSAIEAASSVIALKSIADSL